jgi:hypothetical protein
VSEDDVLFGYRLRVSDHAARTSVSEPVGCSGSIARRSTVGSDGWSGTRWRSCARASGAGRGCRNNARCCSRSGSSPFALDQRKSGIGEAYGDHTLNKRMTRKSHFTARIAHDTRRHSSGRWT